MVYLRLVTTEPIDSPADDQPNCFLCVYHRDVADQYGVGSWCALFDEQIDFEKIAAKNCHAYDPRGPREIDGQVRTDVDT